MLAALYGIITRHQACGNAGRGADQGTLGRVAGFRLPGIRVQCFTAAENRRNARDHQYGISRLAAHSETSLKFSPAILTDWILALRD